MRQIGSPLCGLAVLLFWSGFPRVALVSWEAAGGCRIEWGRAPARGHQGPAGWGASARGAGLCSLWSLISGQGGGEGDLGGTGEGAQGSKDTASSTTPYRSEQVRLPRFKHGGERGIDPNFRLEELPSCRGDSPGRCTPGTKSVEDPGCSVSVMCFLGGARVPRDPCGLCPSTSDSGRRPGHPLRTAVEMEQLPIQGCRVPDARRMHERDHIKISSSVFLGTLCFFLFQS